MPVVRIDMYRGFSAEYKRQLLEGVHEALVHAFQIPEEDRHQILIEHDEADFERAPRRSKQFVIVAIDAYRGRSKDAKRKLYKRIVENLEKSPGVPPSDVLIYLNEPPLENWGVSGGKPADEVDLGFRVDV